MNEFSFKFVQGRNSKILWATDNDLPYLFIVTDVSYQLSYRLPATAGDSNIWFTNQIIESKNMQNIQLILCGIARYDPS